MRMVTIEDVKRRNRITTSVLCKENYTLKQPDIISSNYERLEEEGYRRIISEYILTETPKYDNSDFAFRRILHIFEMVCKNENPSYITKTANLIAETAVPKTRTGTETKDYLKMKVARFKTKLSTKFNNNIRDINGAVSDTIANMKQNLKTNTDSIKSNISKAEVKKEFAVAEGYERIYEAYINTMTCDRIIANQDRLEKTYNIKEAVDSIYDDDRQLIVEICTMIDNFNMKDAIKVNASLENSLYTLAKNNIHVYRKLVLETVLDYYMIHMNPFNEEAKATLVKVIENNKMFSDDDKSGLDSMFKDIAKLDIKFDDSFVLLQEKPDLSKYRSELDILNSLVEETKAPNKVKVLIDKFKLEATKTPEKLKELVYKIYTQSPDQILDGLPNFLSWIRTFFIVGGATMINPLIGVVALIGDQALKLTLSRTQLEKYIKEYTAELEKAKKAVDNAKDDETKKRAKAYQEQIEKSLKKLKEKDDDLYSDADNDARHANDDDGDFDTAEFDDLFNFDEAFANGCYAIRAIAEGVEEYDCEGLTNTILCNFKKYEPEAIKSITDYLGMFPEVANNVLIANAFADYVKETASMPYDSLRSRQRMALREASDKLFVIGEDLSRYKDKFGYGSALRLGNQIDGYNAIMDYNSSCTNLNEMNISNTIKLAKTQLQSVVKSLSDKEKTASRTIDVACSQVSASAERAMTNDNRESVIRGSLIPSASKVIKTAIISGAAWAINPAIAVIGVLGYIGMSKKLQSKERQLILDDIEIELNMCERYLKIAEDNNDMKAQKQLLITKRSLERQRQRIKYKMVVYHNQKVDSKKEDGDEDY